MIIKTIKKRQLKEFIILKHKIYLKKGTLKGYCLVWMHPDQQHILKRNFLDYKELLKFKKLMKGVKTR